MNRIAIPSLVLAALATPAGATEIQISATGPVVELTVQETVEAEPDIATVSAGVTTQAQSAVEAMRANATAMNAVVDRIKALGVAERDIQTSGINLGAQYDYDQTTRQQVFRGYQASNRVSVKLREIDRTGEVLDALVAAGATDLGGPSFSVADPSAARAQARQAAMETARTQALEYARLAGYSDIRLLEITEGPIAQPPMPMMRAMAADSAERSTPVLPGMIEEGVTITVAYEFTS